VYGGYRLRPRVLVAIASLAAADAVLVAGVAWVVGSLGPFLWLLVYVVAAALGGDWSAVDEFVAAVGTEVTPLELGVPPIWIAVGTAALLVVQTIAGYRRAVRSPAVRRLPDGERPELHATLSRLAMAADVPKPDLAVVDSDVPNSFAVGRPGAATVAVTDALLDRLDGRELRAVLAHELAHLKHRDVTAMTIASALVPLADAAIVRVPELVVGSFDRVLIPAVDRSLDALGGVARTDDVGDALKLLLVYVVGGGLALALVVLPQQEWSRYPLLVCLTMAFFFTPLARVPQLVFEVASLSAVGVVARTREFAADRTAARITDDPAALASALEAINDADDRPATDLRAHRGVRALCIAPHGLTGDRSPSGADDPLGRLDGWATIDRPPMLLVETHPPVADRIERLSAMIDERR